MTPGPEQRAGDEVLTSVVPGPFRSGDLLQLLPEPREVRGHARRRDPSDHAVYGRRPLTRRVRQPRLDLEGHVHTVGHRRVARSREPGVVGGPAEDAEVGAGESQTSLHVEHHVSRFGTPYRRPGQEPERQGQLSGDAAHRQGALGHHAASNLPHALALETDGREPLHVEEVTGPEVPIAVGPAGVDTPALDDGGNGGVGGPKAVVEDRPAPVGESPLDPRQREADRELHDRMARVHRVFLQQRRTAALGWGRQQVAQQGKGGHHHA